MYLCIFIFQLKRFAKTNKGPIETNEDIEILRFIENSISQVKMVDLGDIKRRQLIILRMFLKLKNI